MNIKIIIRLPKKIKSELNDIANDLYDDYKGIYASKEHFWITLRELNNVDSFALRQIKSALYSVSSKSDPFLLYCDELSLINAKRKSSLVCSVRGLTAKLYNLHQSINSALFTRGINRDESTYSPNIKIAQRVKYRQLPTFRITQTPIVVDSIALIEKTKKIPQAEYKTIEEYPLFGGHLLVAKIDDDKITCENTYGKSVVLDITEMPIDLKLKDVVVKTGAQFMLDKNETRVRAIQEQIKQEKEKNMLKN